jgi:hypothetical protein
MYVDFIARRQRRGAIHDETTNPFVAPDANTIPNLRSIKVFFKALYSAFIRAILSLQFIFI